MIELTRRVAIAGTAAALAIEGAAAARRKPSILHMFVGTADRGEGLTLLDLDLRTGRMTVSAPNGAIKAATFGVEAPGLHYLVNEAGGRLAVYDAIWTERANVPSLGDGPCHLALDATRSWIAVADYNSNTFVLYGLDAQGFPTDPAVLVTDAGSGPNAERQASPHPHWVGFSPDNKFFYTVDVKSRLGPRVTAYRADPGEGPRHLALHSHLPLAFLVCELGNTLTSLRREPDGRLTRIARVSSLPAKFTGHNQAAHIVMNRKGDRVYVSNRGHNSIAVFKVDQHGRLAHLQTIATGGDWPRFFRLLEDYKFLIVANQRSGGLVLFRVASDGRLKPAGSQVSVMDAAYIGLI
jgi:6-phosphogluconolactonase